MYSISKQKKHKMSAFYYDEIHDPKHLPVLKKIPKELGQLNEGQNTAQTL